MCWKEGIIILANYKYKCTEFMHIIHIGTQTVMVCKVVVMCPLVLEEAIYHGS